MPSPSASPSLVVSPSRSPSPTALPGPTATVYDAEHVSDYLVVLLNERTGEVGCATQNDVTWDIRHFEQRAQDLVDGGARVAVDGDLVLGSLADTIEVFGGTELAATQGPDIAWYLSDPAHIDLVGRGRPIDAELIALQLRRILVQDGHEVWWRTHNFVSVSDGPC